MLPVLLSLVVFCPAVSYVPPSPFRRPLSRVNSHPSASAAWDSVRSTLGSSEDFRSNILGVLEVENKGCRPGFKAENGECESAEYDAKFLIREDGSGTIGGMTADGGQAASEMEYSSLYEPLALRINALARDEGGRWSTLCKYLMGRSAERFEGEDGEVMLRSTVSSQGTFLEDLMADYSALVEDGLVEEDVLTLEDYRNAMVAARDCAVVVNDELAICPVTCFAKGAEVGGDVTMLKGSGGGFLSGVLGGKGRIQVGGSSGVDLGRVGSASYMLYHHTPNSDRGCWLEMLFSLDESDQFYDDKADVLETVGWAEEQSFEVGLNIFDEDTDSDLVRYLRFLCISGEDAFMLESIFRDQIWDFVKDPVSETNERAVCELLIGRCEEGVRILQEIDQETKGARGYVSDMARLVRQTEIDQMEQVTKYIRRDMEALDLKLYYQERRLKELNLDSAWGDEADVMVDSGFSRGSGFDW